MRFWLYLYGQRQAPAQRHSKEGPVPKRLPPGPSSLAVCLSGRRETVQLHLANTFITTVLLLLQLSFHLGNNLRLLVLHDIPFLLDNSPSWYDLELQPFIATAD